METVKTRTFNPWAAGSSPAGRTIKKLVIETKQRVSPNGLALFLVQGVDFICVYSRPFAVRLKVWIV